MKSKILAALSVVASLIIVSGAYAQELLSKEAVKYFNQAVKAQKINDVEKMHEYYQKFSVFYPNYPPVYNNMAIFYLHRGQIDLAEESFLMALRLDPDNYQYLKNLTVFYDTKGDIQKAYAYWKRLTGLDKFRGYELVQEFKGEDEEGSAKAKTKSKR